ncbi:MAG: metallophosphoesterase [Janthinobacterium lividum]
MRVALLADVHGKVLLPFKLVDLYQQETGQKVDVILQCGDLGAYPDLETLDKATVKHAQKDRDELGFHDDFTVEKPEIKQLLDRLDLQMLCVRGNHEDHDYLDQLESQHPQESMFPIDVYKRVWVCKTGLPQQFRAGEEVLSFVGVGRIGDRKHRPDKRFIQDYERQVLKKLLKSSAVFEVLLTHDKDDASQRGYGMAEIRELLDNMPFQYHFHGHTSEPFSRELDVNGVTTSVKIKELEFEPGGVLPAGCMVVLEKTGAELTLTVVDTRLTNKLPKHGWRTA